MILRNTTSKCKARFFSSPFLLLNTPKSSTFDYPTTTTAVCSYLTIQDGAVASSGIKNLNAKEVARSFKEWFKSSYTNSNSQLFDRIFHILKSLKDSNLSSAAADAALSRLNLRVTESLVIEVLKYGHRDGDVLSCLKFFDWAGRQRPFRHTKATIYAVFKILSKERLMSVMLDFLDTYKSSQLRLHGLLKFNNTLVVGYAVAGKPYVALRLFGKMRYDGTDLDDFSYHCLLNALVEQECFDGVEAIFKQISMRGLVSGVTHSIMLKGLCKRRRWDEAETYLEKLLEEGKPVNGHALGILVDAFCKMGRFKQAGKLLEKCRDMGVVSLGTAYGVWLGSLTRSQNLEGALEFLKNKKLVEGYVPEVFQYNQLMSRLLRENRLIEVFDSLTEMREEKVLPDKVTMNTALCFFCKVGMVDVALELYKCRSEFGLTPSGMAYNYLINTLCGDGSTVEALGFLKQSLEEGFFPNIRTLHLLADALVREKKVNRLKELVALAVKGKCEPSVVPTYNFLIQALCRVGLLKDAYLIHEELTRTKDTSEGSYVSLILGFSKSDRQDIACTLLIEMQEKGHRPSQALFRSVIFCLCDMKNPEMQFLVLLRMQLSLHKTDRQIYDYFIYGAGHAKRPDLTALVYNIMQENGVEPTLSTNMYLLQSYLKSEKFASAINFFRDCCQRGKNPRTFYNTMVVGLCKANKAYIALHYLSKMRNNGMYPSNECYEEMIKLLCSKRRFDVVVNILNQLEKGGFQLTTFIGNVLLFHAFKTRTLYEAWIQLRDRSNETSKYSLLGQIIGIISGCVKMDKNIEKLDEVVEQCFPLDVYTYNLLFLFLRKGGMDHAFQLYNRMCQKGYQPNSLTYKFLIEGFYGKGRSTECQKMVEELFHKQDMSRYRDACRENEVY